MQVRKLIASDQAALERFNSSLLESYVEVIWHQVYLPLRLPQTHAMHCAVICSFTEMQCICSLVSDKSHQGNSAGNQARLETLSVRQMLI